MCAGVFFFQAEDGIRDIGVTGVQTCALPIYATDWESARESVRRLAALEPEVAATGHGRPLRGPLMRQALRTLAQDFDMLAVPRHGRYVNAPAIADANGVVSVPPPVRDPLPGILMGIGAAVVVGAAVRSMRGRSGAELPYD